MVIPLDLVVFPTTKKGVLQSLFKTLLLPSGFLKLFTFPFLMLLFVILLNQDCLLIFNWHLKLLLFVVVISRPL